MEGLKQRDVQGAKAQTIEAAKAELKAAEQARKTVGFSDVGAWHQANDRVQKAEDRLYIAQHGERSDLGRVPNQLRDVEPRIHEAHRTLQVLEKEKPEAGIKSPFTRESLKTLGNEVRPFLDKLERAIAPTKEGRDPGQEVIKAIGNLCNEVGRAARALEQTQGPQLNR